MIPGAGEKLFILRLLQIAVTPEPLLGTFYLDLADFAISKESSEFIDKSIDDFEELSQKVPMFPDIEIEINVEFNRCDECSRRQSWLASPSSCLNRIIIYKQFTDVVFSSRM